MKEAQILIALAAIINFVPTSAVKITNLDVPKTAYIGGTATLGCKFDLENETLISVSWFKNGDSFFHYDGTSKQIHTTPVSGVNVDMKLSNMNQVTLTGLTSNSTGTYKCEVATAGAPFTTTIGEEEKLTVVEPPKGSSNSSVLKATGGVWILASLSILYCNF